MHLDFLPDTFYNDRIDGGVDMNVNAIPEYWEKYLEEKIQAINTLHTNIGKDCFSFVVMTDVHYPKNAGYSPALAERILKKTKAEYALCLGDVQTSWCHDTRDEVYAENVLIDKFFEPVRDKLLMTEGNHDGCYGWLDRDGNGEYNNTTTDGTVKPPHLRETYVNNLTPDEIYDSFYKYTAERFEGVTFAHGDSHGYWVDDVVSKTRFIMLNICHCPYELQEDDTPLYPKMWIFRFGQEQFDMVAAALNSVPDNSWSVVLGAHTKLNKAVTDGEQMKELLNSYKHRKAYQTVAETRVGESLVADYDFTEAKGELVGYFFGHIHEDTEDVTSGIAMISTTCDAIEDIDLDIRNSRTKGTVSEHSFDVFTVDKGNKTIYATRIGSGADRIIKYE